MYAFRAQGLRKYDTLANRTRIETATKQNYRNIGFGGRLHLFALLIYLFIYLWYLFRTFNGTPNEYTYTQTRQVRPVGTCTCTM